jgi:hypothetical protein
MSIPHLAHFVTFLTRGYVGDTVCLQPVGLMRGSPCHRPSTIPHRRYMSVPTAEHACFPLQAALALGRGSDLLEYKLNHRAN